MFRVDNPHTKALAFWEWLIGEVKPQYPEAIFLAEAFTRPKIMYRLAKLGFTQSYTYFTWRNTKAELIEYFTELTQTDGARVLPPEPVAQHAGHSARALADAAAGRRSSRGWCWPATLGVELRHLRPGVREAASTCRASPAAKSISNSEKYQIRAWDFSRPENLGGVIATVNRVRRENPALQCNDGLRFHPTDNEQLLCYSKRTRRRQQSDA